MSFRSITESLHWTSPARVGEMRFAAEAPRKQHSLGLVTGYVSFLGVLSEVSYRSQEIWPITDPGLNLSLVIDQ